jgi:hypothetical protein
MRRIAVVAALALLLLPGVAKADSVVFNFAHGIVSVTFAPGSFVSNETQNAGGATVPRLSTLTGAAGVPGNSITGSNLGTVGFTSGALTGTTSSGGNIVGASFAPGGDINVVAASGAFSGIAGGTTLFSGVFSSGQSFIWNCLNPLGSCSATPLQGGNWTLSGTVTTNNLNPQLLSLLGVSGGFPTGTFSSIQLDVSFRYQGGVVQSGTITLVPEPATLSLLGTGLIGIAGLLRRRSKN